ncbi:MAG: hypothetical protein IH911_02340 [Proteobacteria bacterium]|nr:hypothetical protein [Pseudomonadota bacterium]
MVIDRIIVTVSIISFLGACATASRGPTIVDIARVSVTGAELRYHGHISHEANARLFALAATSATKPRRLVVTSQGGNVEAGMELGEWVFDEGLDVYVPEYCVSSCANYVFPAGKRKFLNDSAMLFWHGGALQELPDVESLCDEVDWREEMLVCDEAQLLALRDSTVARIKVREAAFFATIKVDQNITVLGQYPDYDCMRSGGYSGWYYSIQDMETMGVTDIVVYGDAWQPVTPLPEIRICQVILGRPAIETLR